MCERVCVSERLSRPARVRLCSPALGAQVCRLRAPEDARGQDLIAGISFRGTVLFSNDT